LRKYLILVAAVTIILSGCNNDTAAPAKPNETPPVATTPSTTPAPNTATPPAAGTTTPPAATAPAASPTPPPAPAVTPTAPEVQRPAGAKETPTATTEQLGKVDFGMTYDDVGKAMGQMGKLTNESMDEGGVNKVQTYEYKTKDGGVLKVTFRNGKVINTSEASR
jgi:type IV secretory pathway VirB10-like protein